MIFRIITQFIDSILTFLRVPAFIRDHQLWKGFAKHKLVVFAMMLIGVLLSLRLMSIVMDWWSQLDVSDPLQAGKETTALIAELATGGYELMFAGAYKYMVLIIMEMLIFHMTLRTHEILDGRTESLTPGIFLKAQIRMIKVSVFIFAMELLVSIGAKAVLAIFGLSFFKGVVLLLIQSFFLGFALIDNYNEIHHLSIRDSYRNTLRFTGVAAGIGMILYLLILIPLIGPVVGPMIGAIAATLIMHKLDDNSPQTMTI
ncbi:MAG: hypothetical protein HKN76_06210 [Saprospiraceae bacterium]|nr:hypothetical protein [Saprospiraceae bacterium]